MKKFIFSLLATLISFSVFAQSADDTYVVNKADGTSQSYKVMEFPNIKFNGDGTFGNYMTGFDDFGQINVWNISDVKSVTFNIAHSNPVDVSGVFWLMLLLTMQQRNSISICGLFMVIRSYRV